MTTAFRFFRFFRFYRRGGMAFMPALRKAFHVAYRGF